MARSLIQRRAEAERARAEAFDVSLRRVSQEKRPAPDFYKALQDAKHGFASDIVRDAWAWKPRMKSRDPARLRLAAARYLFARYPVAAHLEQIWISTEGLDRAEILLRKRWYIAAAGGGSLYRAGAGDWLSRKETHVFLNAPGRLGFEAAFWYAIARTYTPDAGLALRIAHSKIARTSRAGLGFWREVARFFATHPTTLEQMDDLCDFLAACTRQDRSYSLKGRTLASLTRQMRQWHHDLAIIHRIDAARRRAEGGRQNARRGAFGAGASVGGHWSGAALEDWSWSPSEKAKDKAKGKAKANVKRETYHVVQLRSGADLVAETRAMRHCVASYAAKCIAGHATIWSLRRRISGTTERLLTIELDAQNRAVQVRGFANRVADGKELKILARWSKARGVVLV